MSKLEEVLAKAKKALGKEEVPKKKLKKMSGCGTRMMKAITVANDILESSGDKLEKAAFDSMAHHHQHAAAAESAAWQCTDDKDGSKSKECRSNAKKHATQFVQHALNHASKRAHSSYDVGNKVRKYMGMFDDESYHHDPEHQKVVDHYKKGGEYKAHKDDSKEGK
jgi:hypothetical protein